MSITVEFMTQPEMDVDDIIGLTCRQLAQQFDPEQSVWIRGDEELLSSLQAVLWSFQATAFLPHIQLFDAARVPESHQGLTPIILSSHEPKPFAYRQLWNLADTIMIPDVLPVSSLRIVELVSNVEALKAASRQHFAAYRRAGLSPTMTEISP